MINIRITLKGSGILLILFFPLFASAQPGVLLPELMATSKGTHVVTAGLQLQEFEQRLTKKNCPSDYQLLQTLFTKTHKKFLKHFSQYPDLDEVFVAGNYDCLTATSLFSIVLSDFSFRYRIVETNYHIFLIVQTSRGDVLIETTDRYNGFVSGKKEIEKRLSSYKQSNSRPTFVTSAQVYHAYHFDLYQDVDPNQLAGLLYFNQAVKAFNKRELINAADLLDKAKSIYESPRVAELAVILVDAVLDSDLNESSKHLILQQYKIYWEQRDQLMAANSR